MSLGRLGTFLRALAPCNALQVSDGAAAVLLMTRAEAARRGLPVLGIFRSFAAVGVDPAVMGIGPAVAIPAALKMAGLSADDIDVFELNEAFASQVLPPVACCCTCSLSPGCPAALPQPSLQALRHTAALPQPPLQALCHAAAARMPGMRTWGD